MDAIISCIGLVLLVYLLREYFKDKRENKILTLEKDAFEFKRKREQKWWE